MAEVVSELWRTIVALLSGGAIVWAGIANGWFQRKKIDAEVRKSDLDIHKEQISTLREENVQLRKLLDSANESLALSQERSLLREINLTKTIQDQEKRIHILEETVAKLVIKANL